MLPSNVTHPLISLLRHVMLYCWLQQIDTHGVKFFPHTRKCANEENEHTRARAGHKEVGKCKYSDLLRSF